MKKYIAIAFALVALTVQAQQNQVLKSKRGINILPQQGEYCLGFGTNSVFTYLGNMFNGNNQNNSPSLTLPGGSVFAKYMKTNDYAYRASFVFGLSNRTVKYTVPDLSPGAANQAMLDDKVNTSSGNLGLSFGFEKRKGLTRIQGYYGAEGVLNYSFSGTNYNYGNKIEHHDTGFVRTLSVKSGSRFSIGARAFAGVEYFVAPKVSLGGEFGFGMYYSITGANDIRTESYDFIGNQRVEQSMSSSSGANALDISTDNFNGVIKLLFYF